MQETWTPPCWVYDVDLLAYHLRKPSVDPDLLVGLEEEGTGDLLAYCAYMPLDVDVAARPRRGVFGSFLTAARALQGRGAARAIQRQLLQAAIAKGYELYLAFCEEGAVSTHSAVRSSASLGLTTTLVATCLYVALPGTAIRARTQAPSGTTRRYEDGDEASLVALMDLGGARATVHRRHDRRDYRHRFAGPRARSFVRAEGEQVRAFAHVLLLDVLDSGRRFRNAYLQDFEAGDLTEAERRQFLNDVLRELEPDAVALVMAPVTGYLPRELLGSMGFRQTSRRLNLLSTPLRVEGNPMPLQVASFCLDVF